MPIDDSFKKPGAVPFKWEIRPGVPKLHNHHPPPSNHRPSSLKPPPSSPSPSFTASPRTQSSRFHFDKRAMMGRPEVVALGCFQARKGGQKKTNNKLHADPVYKADIETLSQWSMSTQNSRSPFYNDSPLSSSFSSYRPAAPWMASDVEWAGYGLF